MEKAVSMTVIVGTLLFGALPTNAWAELCNPSFEDDGEIADIFATEPNCWDVNGDPWGFYGQVDTDWPTDANYNLTLIAWVGPFNAGDTVTVSQTVYLTDVNAVIFDVNLATEAFGGGDAPWDPCNCSAVLLIDGDVVWESNSMGSDVRGEYFDQLYEVDALYHVTDPVRLSLGLKVKDTFLPDDHIVNLDNVRMTIGCGGAGYLAGDLDGDCWVDANDLRILAGMWLDKVKLNGGYDVHGGPSYGFVDFRDFAVYADGWDGTFPGLADISEKWLQYVGPSDTANYDQVVTGIVDFRDFAVLADDWLKSSYD